MIESQRQHINDSYPQCIEEMTQNYVGYWQEHCKNSKQSSCKLLKFSKEQYRLQSKACLQRVIDQTKSLQTVELNPSFENLLDLISPLKEWKSNYDPNVSKAPLSDLWKKKWKYIWKEVWNKFDHRYSKTTKHVKRNERTTQKITTLHEQLTLLIAFKSQLDDINTLIELPLFLDQQWKRLAFHTYNEACQFLNHVKDQKDLKQETITLENLFEIQRRLNDKVKNDIEEKTEKVKELVTCSSFKVKYLLFKKENFTKSSARKLNAGNLNKMTQTLLDKYHSLSSQCKTNIDKQIYSNLKALQAWQIPHAITMYFNTIKCKHLILKNIRESKPKKKEWYNFWSKSYSPSFYLVLYNDQDQMQMIWSKEREQNFNNQQKKINWQPGSHFSIAVFEKRGKEIDRQDQVVLQKEELDQQIGTKTTLHLNLPWSFQDQVYLNKEKSCSVQIEIQDHLSKQVANLIP
jgi:hypothetical protein